MAQHFSLMHTKICQQETKQNKTTSLLISHCVSVSQEAVSSLTTTTIESQAPEPLPEPQSFPKIQEEKESN